MTQNLVLDAKLNQDSYNSNNTSGMMSQLDGWVRFSVTRYELPAGSNFAAQLYQGPDGNYKIAYRGTVNPLGAGDAAMNTAIVSGQWTAEMSESIKFTLAVIQQVAPDKGISFADARNLFNLTGHSQGGFEAELNAKFFGTGATSIDGPGASPLIGVTGSNGMAGTKPYANGFAALKSLDSNSDNQFTSADAAWSQLRVWTDANHDGKTDAGELKTFAELGITAINLASTSQSGEVRDGNEVLARGSFTQNSTTREAIAANFLVDTNISDAVSSSQGGLDTVIARVGGNTNVLMANRASITTGVEWRNAT